MSILSTLTVLASEGGIPASSPFAKLAVPIGILIFVGPVFVLLRSNLGTRLGYLVMSTSLWGSTFLLALFWTFGAPGTPAFTGPQNLPGQVANEYQPLWVGLAQDANAVTEDGSPYAVISGYPAGFSADSTITDEQAEEGASEVRNFFSSIDGDGYINLLTGLEKPVSIEHAVATNGRPIIAVTYAATCQLDPNGELPAGCEAVNDIAPADTRVEDVLLFGFFDEGAEAFPSYLMLGATFLLFAVHMVLMARDEVRARKETEQETVVEEEAVEEKATVSA